MINQPLKRHRLSGNRGRSSCATICGPLIPAWGAGVSSRGIGDTEWQKAEWGLN